MLSSKPATRATCAATRSPDARRIEKDCSLPRNPGGEPRPLRCFEAPGLGARGGGGVREADGYLQLAVHWRESNARWRTIPKSPTIWWCPRALYRGMKTTSGPPPRSTACWPCTCLRWLREHRRADDFSRMAQIDMDRKRLPMAASSLNAAVGNSQEAGWPAGRFAGADLDRLGEVSTTLRRYDRAEEAFRLALVIRETLYGRSTPTCCQHRRPGVRPVGQKKYDQSEPLYPKADRAVGLVGGRRAAHGWPSRWIKWRVFTRPEEIRSATKPPTGPAIRAYCLPRGWPNRRPAARGAQPEGAGISIAGAGSARPAQPGLPGAAHGQSKGSQTA